MFFSFANRMAAVSHLHSPRQSPVRTHGGGGGGGEGGGSSQYIPMDDLVQAMLTNSQAMLSSSQALAETLAADRARREAADRIQRESWEAALKEKDAEIERFRAESDYAKKKLQADASRKIRWEAAYELLLGANKKFAELRDADMEDSRTCAETPNSKEVESCTNLSQNTVDHTASDFRKLKKTPSPKKDKEVSALLSEKDSLRSQLDIMQQDYGELLKNKKVEAAQATEAVLKLQKSVDELKALAQKKDGEIARLQAEAVGAKKKHDKDLSALLSEKDSVHNQLSIMQHDYTELLKKKKVLTHKKDHEIVILRAVAVGAKKKGQKMHALVKEKDDEIRRLKGRHPESVQKYNKDTSETHKRSRPGDLAVTVRDKLENSGIGQTVEEDYISETRTAENDGQDECTHKRRRSSPMSNDDEKSGSNGDDDEQIGSEEDGDKPTGSDEDGDKPTGSDDDSMDAEENASVENLDGNEKEEESEQDGFQGYRGGVDMGCGMEDENGGEGTTNSFSGLQFENLNKGNVGMRDVMGFDDGFSEKLGSLHGMESTNLLQAMNSIPAAHKGGDKPTGSDEDVDKQSGSDEGGDKQSGSDEDGDKQSGSDEDGDKQSGSDEDGGEQSGSGEDSDGDDNEYKGDIRTRYQSWGSWRAPAPLRQKKLKITDGRRYMVATGHWGKYVKAVNDSLVDRPDKHKEFVRFLNNFESWSVRHVARIMEVILDRQPKLIRQFNHFLPNHCQIDVKEEEEKQLPEVEEPCQRGVPQPRGQLPSASPSVSAAAGLIKLKEAEHQSKWERV